MTVLVGVLCQDGVVIGSDSSATFAASHAATIEQPAQKTFLVGYDVLFAGSGQRGLGQRFEAILTRLRADPKFVPLGHLEVAKNISAATLRDFAFTSCPPGQFGALVAFAGADGFHLCEFAVTDFQPEFKTPDTWFVSMGTGQPITDPFLGLLRRVFFRDSRPLVKEGIFAVTWALEHAIELNTGGINGPSQVGVLTQSGTGNSFSARLLTSAELAEYSDNVRDAEAHLAAYRQILAKSGTPPPTGGPPSPAP